MGLPDSPEDPILAMDPCVSFLNPGHQDSSKKAIHLVWDFLSEYLIDTVSMSMDQCDLALVSGS